MANRCGSPCSFQDQIYGLSVNPHIQSEALPKPEGTRQVKSLEKKYLKYLNAIAVIIAIRIGNGQHVATTCVRSPTQIKILWALGAGRSIRCLGPEAAQGLTYFLRGIRRQVFNCDNLQDVLQYIVLKCKKTILRFFHEVARCMARGSSSPVESSKPRSTNVRGWSSEIRMLVRETHHRIATDYWSTAMDEARAVNYEIFVEKVSNVDKDTTSIELVELIVYSYFLTQPFFGRTAPISEEVNKSLVSVGLFWEVCIEFRRYVTSHRRKYRQLPLRIEFEHLPTLPQQTFTHLVSPLAALQHAARSDTSIGADKLLANLSTYPHIPLPPPGLPTLTTTTTSIPHPELRIANYLFNDYKSRSGSFQYERDFPIG
ncbi:MAG: hypothetical protein Q9168_007469 [Polycauliona sp. 1 TL-2023]